MVCDDAINTFLPPIGEFHTPIPLELRENVLRRQARHGYLHHINFTLDSVITR